MITVACCQVSLDIDRPEHSLSTVEKSICVAAEAGAQIIVLPELADSGYYFASRNELLDTASVVYPESRERFLSMLKSLSELYKVVIVSGLAEKSEDPEPHVYSSSVILDCGRLVGKYRKAHLWDKEKELFDVGDQPPLVVDTTYGRVATAICYDIEFPEMVRVASQSGAFLLAAPVNWPFHEKPEGFSWPIEIHKVMAAAAQYRISIAVCDRVGRERNMEWEGGSVIVAESGWPTSVPDPSVTLRKESVVIAQVNEDPSAVLGEFNHALKDRRPELYHEAL